MIKLSDEKQKDFDEFIRFNKDAGIDIEAMGKSVLDYYSQQGFLKEGKPNAIVKRQKLPRKLKKKHKKEYIYDFDIIMRNVPVKKVELDLKLNML